MAMEPMLIDASENGDTDSASECCQTDDNDNYNDNNSDNDDEDEDDDTITKTNNQKRYRRLAMACDDGSLRLYTISDLGDVCYRKTFPRVSGMLIYIFLILSISCVPYLAMHIVTYIFIYRCLFGRTCFKC